MSSWGLAENSFPLLWECFQMLAKVTAAAEAEKTLAVAVSNPAAADALRAKRAERAGAALADELAGPIHALSIVAKTPEQWAKSSGVTPSFRARSTSAPFASSSRPTRNSTINQPICNGISPF